MKIETQWGSIDFIPENYQDRLYLFDLVKHSEKDFQKFILFEFTYGLESSKQGGGDAIYEDFNDLNNKDQKETEEKELLEIEWIDKMTIFNYSQFSS